MSNQTKLFGNIPEQIPRSQLLVKNSKSNHQIDVASAPVATKQSSSVLSKPKRMSVSLPVEIAELLEFLAKVQGISQNEALRKAISTEAYIQQEIREGSTVLIQKSNKKLKEVVFR